MWPQKKSAGVLRGQGHLWWHFWLLHVTYPKMPFLLPNLDWTTTEDHQTHWWLNVTRITQGDVSRSSREPEHTKSTCCLQTSPHSTYEEYVSPICSEKSLRECWWLEKGHVVWWNCLSVHVQQRIKGIWVQKLTPESFLYLAVSMPKKLQSVIQAKHHTTKWCIVHI